MPLPSSGAISLNEIHIEAGGSSGSQASLNDADIRAIIGKGSGASNSFNEYYGASGSTPSISSRGSIYTTGNGFPAGYVSLSSGTKVVVVTCQLAGSGNTYVSLGGTGMTLAAKVDTVTPVSGIWQAAYTSAIYYLQTSSSGTVYVAGNGGSGRSVIQIFEITGYNSSTPYTTDTAQQTNVDHSASITVASQYNGLTVGSVITEDTIPVNSVTVSNADATPQLTLELASSHVAWYEAGTPSGNRTYTVTQVNPGNNVIPGGTLFQMTTASWK